MMPSDRLSSQSHDWGYGTLSPESGKENGFLARGSSINDDSENQVDPMDPTSLYSFLKKTPKQNIEKTVRQRQRVITCISTILCPITCPVWISVACLCNR